MKYIKKHQALRMIIPWLVPLLLIFFWYEATLHPSDTLLLPSPSEVVDRAIAMLKTGELQNYIFVSTKRAFMGFFIGGLIGFVLGLINGLSVTINLFFNTTVQMLRNIPALAIIPLMIIWFGIGEEMKVILVAFGVFFPIYANTYHGIKSVDQDLLEMGSVYGFSRFSMFKNIIFPSALSSILVGVRLSLGIMWLVLIAAETVATDAGIGYMAMTARGLMQMDKVVLSIILYALLGKLSDVLASIVEKRCLRWKKI